MLRKGDHMSLDTKRIEGKLCIVTGAARSVGYEIAKRFCQYGGIVAMLDKNQAVADAARELREAGYQAWGYAADVTEHDAIGSLCRELMEEHGPAFVLVNAAGIMEISPFEETTQEIWRNVLDINLMGTVNCIQGVIGRMREEECGKIINFASKAGKMGSKLMTVYGASKGAIITLTQALAMEYAPYHLNINCICPDIIDDTGVWQQANTMYAHNLKMSKEEVKELYEGKVPLGRFATKEDIADLVSFYVISGDDCTGQSLNITGGRCMH